jgi:dynein heavy chain
MCLKTEVTNNYLTEDITEAPATGAYVNGMTLEGAGWELGRNGEQGYLCDMILKELSPELPITHVTAIRRQAKQVIGFYVCPLYFTTARGAAQLITKFDIAMESEDTDDKMWILSGVALFLAPE